MLLNILILCISILFSGPNTIAWNTNCDVKKDAKVQQRQSAALLYAHRCFLKDVPISIPAPLNTIPDIIVPSHVVVPRCSGKELAIYLKLQSLNCKSAVVVARFRHCLCVKLINNVKKHQSKWNTFAWLKIAETSCNILIILWLVKKLWSVYTNIKFCLVGSN